MSGRAAIVASCLVGLAGTAIGQSQRVVYTQENSEFTTYGAEPTGPDVAVSGLAALVCGNTRLALYSRTTTLPAPGPLDLRLLPDPAASSTPMVPQSPFELSSPVGFVERFGDPRATYDAANDRLWMVYAEFTEPRCGGLSKLHLAVSKDPADFGGGPLNTLADTHWWYYTGETMRPPAVAVSEGSFDLSLGVPLAEVFKSYKQDNDGSNLGLEGVLRVPTIAIDGTRASGRGVAVFTPNAAELSCDGPGNSPIPGLLFPALLIVPLEHEDDMGNLVSILDGDRPDESDMILLDLTSDDSSPGTDRIEDFAEAPYAVQEPFEQYDNAVFLISGSSSRNGVLEDTIRLKGLFYDDTASAGQEWTLQQRVSSGMLEDMDLNNDTTTLSALAFHPTPPTELAPRPRTPDMSALNWGPGAEGYIFHSAVLTKDTSGNDRIFAVHSVFPDDGGTAVNKWVIQWYVIDPNLANFRSTPAPSSMWNPTVVAKGRLSADQNDEGDRYHPVIIVNRQGQAFIEYTYSDEETWPEIRRVRLNNTYTGIVGSETPAVLSGPAVPYEEGPIIGVPLSPRPSWANYAGAQADPFNACAYWTTHTLVDDNAPMNPAETRDVWLFHQAYSNSTGPNCFQSPNMLDLNDDNEVDAFDMMEFSPMFDRRARRVDVDGNGVVDATDMRLFVDAYDGYTRRR